MRRKALIVLSAAAIMMALSTGAAVAAPGGQGKGHAGSVPCGSPTLAGPSSATVGTSYTVTGCGFQAGATVPLTVGEAGGCCYGINLQADSSGQISYTGNVWGAGVYTFKAAVMTASGWKTGASYSFSAS